MTPASFRLIVWRFYKAHGRHTLPWRKNQTLYRVLVSEVMLQQTQVDRVIPYYTRFLKQFPTAKKLAAAPLSEALRAWQGLGYNRRAKMLHDAAKILTRSRPSSIHELERLPGAGPYTARAVAAFAWNEDTIVIETNIRTAVIHHFFSRRARVEDAEIVEVLRRAFPKGRSREWYGALMDYGAYLKRNGISYTQKSAEYVKQKPLKGSIREARGAVLRELANGRATRTALLKLLGGTRTDDVSRAMRALEKENLIVKKRSQFTLPN
ncbi:A/G-specific adenine glycosylase [Patescibacteria group bacterium]|nr:A/G-specific adenine glycosylase [Patescibacteria group bacterium]